MRLADASWFYGWTRGTARTQSSHHVGELVSAMVERSIETLFNRSRRGATSTTVLEVQGFHSRESFEYIVLRR
jgi:hypothetical protein